jgi:hypothetical protein
LDSECETLISDFLRQRHGHVAYPIATDDLTVLLENLAASLDLYADLTTEGPDVEGVTDFFPGKKPAVRISARLCDGRMENRLRTTLTHELGHVKLHTFMFDGGGETLPLFGASRPPGNRCKRDTIIGASQSDWMEWQAGYACGAFLMPATALASTIRAFVVDGGYPASRFATGSAEGRNLIDIVMSTYTVSSDAARVRLEQRGTLTPQVAGSLFR